MVAVFFLFVTDMHRHRHRHRYSQTMLKNSLPLIETNMIDENMEYPATTIGMNC